jgi:hypothetical protein
MKRLVIAALAACSSKKQPPPPPAPPPVAKPDAAVASPRPAMHSSKAIDLPDTPIAQLQLFAVVAQRDGGYESENGVFDIRWHAPETQDTAVVCRVEAYNLACTGKPDESMVGQHDVRYRTAPFVIAPKVCEVRFFDAHRKVVARACYQDGPMTTGACPAGAFPPPKLPDRMAIDVQGASAHVMPTSLEVRALVTTAAAQQPELAVSCDGIASTAPVALPAIDAGETRYIVVPVAMQKPLAADPKQCELRVSSKGKALGTFCLAEGSTDSGPCPK